MAWNSGDHLIVRGADWRVIRSTSFSDCEALDLANEHINATRTLLLPFDRPYRPSQPRFQVVSRKRWAREVSSHVQAMHPYGGLQFCPPSIQLLPYQLEPALAVLRHGAVRVLIADDVGLGKTIEAGLIVREIAMRQRLSRTLIVAPAAIREQWKHELANLFGIAAIVADAGWLRQTSREVPPDVNPWSFPSVYLSSLDFVKRAEALYPLEEVRWDLLVVDEAHAATPGSDRGAAIQALASRSRILLLLTATPHSGDDDQFGSLCAIGAERDSPAMIVFNRSRADTPLEKPLSRSRLLPIRQSHTEQRIHRLLEEYTARIWAESTSRDHSNGTLLATVLRKRALSSLSSLALSLRRRLNLLSGAASEPTQLALPLWQEERIDEDRVADVALAGAGLSDQHLEREMLGAIAEQSELAAPEESKVRTLMRLLRGVREPAIVFTEYRDTGEHLSRVLTAAGHRVCVLHGGLSPGERAAVTNSFRSGQYLLVATDAASEGLNLHQSCRFVVHFELPWTPSRLRQRRGRVDRIGQARRVHEVALVASDTCEQLVLAPLLQRALRSRAFGKSPLMDEFSESRVAAHVLGGVAIGEASPARASIPVPLQIFDYRAEARQEVQRLSQLRRLESSRVANRSGKKRQRIVPIARSRRRSGSAGEYVTLVLGVSLRDECGSRCDEHPLVLAIELAGIRWQGKSAALRQQVQHFVSHVRRLVDPLVDRFIESRIAAVAPTRAAANQSRRSRDAHLQRQLRSTAREIVQAGLFDRRALRTVAARDRGRAIALEDLGARIASVGERVDHIGGSYEVLAVCVGGRA